ncbi:AbrB/MazE/SpoVT family DNA-binding domain-containing protein [Candidatus Berkelbacteria bacterium]|nr:AbrB/MazE/SpoVT family DNA-binding domain-containing protein [Candidatus Berkelbacteria bacterium]
MKAKIVRIGNSRGVRIPKPLIDISGLDKDVEIRAKKGRIVIEPAAANPVARASETTLLSERALAKDWDRPEEDEAWRTL